MEKRSVQIVKISTMMNKIKPTQKEIAQYYGVTERTLRNWAKATDGRQHLLQAAKEYYINHSKGIG